MKTVIYLQTLIVILSFLFHSCSSEEVDKCDKEIITFLPAVSVSTRSTMERGFEEGDKIGIFLFDQNKAAKWKYGSECWVRNIMEVLAGILRCNCIGKKSPIHLWG